MTMQALLPARILTISFTGVASTKGPPVTRLKFPVARKANAPNAQTAMKNAVTGSVRIAKTEKPAVRMGNAPAMEIAARSLKPVKSGL